jgi:hypothetical protein
MVVKSASREIEIDLPKVEFFFFFFCLGFGRKGGDSTRMLDPFQRASYIELVNPCRLL